MQKLDCAYVIAGFGRFFMQVGNNLQVLSHTERAVELTKIFYAGDWTPFHKISICSFSRTSFLVILVPLTKRLAKYLAKMSGDLDLLTRSQNSPRWLSMHFLSFCWVFMMQNSPALQITRECLQRSMYKNFPSTSKQLEHLHGKSMKSTDSMFCSILW